MKKNSKESSFASRCREKPMTERTNSNATDKDSKLSEKFKNQ